MYLSRLGGYGTVTWAADPGRARRAFNPAPKVRETRNTRAETSTAAGTVTRRRHALLLALTVYAVNQVVS